MYKLYDHFFTCVIAVNLDIDVDSQGIGTMYYDLKEFNNLTANTDNLIILHQNIRSFHSNFDKLSNFLKNLDREVDILILTETWFREGLCSGIAGYKAFHVNRPDKVGGGVSIYVKKTIHSVMNHNLSNCSDICEACVVEINPNINDRKRSFVVVGVYKPPS